MKLLHTADWHIGRTLNGFSLLDEQQAIFQQILQIAETEQVDGIVIAGDIYDRGVPSTSAVTALNQMLTNLNLKHHFPIYAISGNHDSAERLNYGRDWLATQGFHLNTRLADAFQPIETPTTQIFLLPFFDPMDARAYYAKQGVDEETVKAIHSISDAMARVVADMQAHFDPDKRHLLVTHFAVTPSGANPEDLTSETTSKVGGLATLSTQQFDCFDYVMLGHIHTRNASPDRERMRYAGSPVKFNVKEANEQKGVDIVTITADQVTHTFKPLQPQTDLVALKAPWEQLTDPDFYDQQPRKQAWFAITIQDFDRSQHLNVRAQLQKIYGTVVELDYEDHHRPTAASQTRRQIATLSPDEIVNTFFETVTGKDLSAEQAQLVDQIFTKLSKEHA